MHRTSRNVGTPVRAFVYAVVIHIIFGALLGVSLLIQPQAVTPAPASPVQAKAIDLAAIEREKRRIEQEKKKAQAEKKRKAEEKHKAEEKKKKEAERKKKLEAEKKKKAQAEKKRKAEAERKRKEAEKAKKVAEAKAQREHDESDAVSAFGAVAWAIKEQVSKNWSEPGDFSGLSVEFLVKVDREGNVKSVKMTRSSGDARLDESAENAIFKASPLPFPGEARFYEYLKEFNFIFKPES